MIRKIHVKNYRSIKDLTIDLRPFNCFVGANNSGKSNLFDVFSFLFDIVRNGLGSAVNTRGGDKLRYYGAEGTEPILIEITIDSPNGAPDSELQYLLSFNATALIPEQETLVHRTRGGEAQTLVSLQPTRAGTHNLEVLQGGRQPVRIGITGPLGEPLLRSHEPGWLGDGLSPMRALNQYIRGFRAYYFKPDRLKLYGQATHTEALARDGGNFASYLHHVHSGYGKYFDRIGEQLMKNFPEVGELLTPLSPAYPGATEVGIRERWFKRSSSGAQLSDGIVGFLAHLVVLYGPDEPTLVSFEEPENYINPRLLERLVDMLKEASKEVQILISTHSVPLLDYLDLEDIIVVERPEGGTVAKRVSDQEELREALKGWALGEAYASGAMDGTG